MAIALTNTLLRRAIEDAGYGVPSPGKLHLVGLRGCVPHGLHSVSLADASPATNRYDDTIATFGTTLALFRGTVDPGRSWTLNPSNPGGCAHLCDGGPYRFRWGTHKSTHPALVEAAPLSYWRDRDRDGQHDAGERVVRHDPIGLHIHAMGAGPEVGSWSAGCQGVAGGWDGEPWGSFTALLRASGQAEFCYWLLDARKLTG